jgi:hypothetical protein
LQHSTVLKVIILFLEPRQVLELVLEDMAIHIRERQLSEDLALHNPHSFKIQSAGKNMKQSTRRREQETLQPKQKCFIKEFFFRETPIFFLRRAAVRKPT